MMLNISDSNSKALGSLMMSANLNQRNCSTQVRSGSTHKRRRISNARQDTIEFLLFCSVPGRDEAWVEGPPTDSLMRELNVEKTQAPTRTTNYTNNDGTYAEDYDRADTYRDDLYFEQDYS